MSTKSSPAQFLQSVMGRPVIVKLNSGIEYRGVLACLDGFMNIALEVSYFVHKASRFRFTFSILT